MVSKLQLQVAAFACCFIGFSNAASAATAPLPDQLNLETAILMSLENNYMVRIADVQVQQAEQEVRVAGEEFETTGSADLSSFRQEINTAPGTPTFGDGEQLSISAQKRFVTGTEVWVAASATQIDDANDYAGLTVDVTQPLLRGGSIRANRAPIAIANRRLDISREGFRQHVIDTLSEVHFAYYDAMLADENLNVARESLALSEQLLRENQRRAEIGSIATSDLLQAEAEVAGRKEQVHLAEISRAYARNNLKNLVANGTFDLIQWDFRLQPLDQPSERIVDLRSDFYRALQQRPDYQEAVISLDIAGIERLRASNNALPSLDLYARMSLFSSDRSVSSSISGLSGDADSNTSIGIRLSRSFSNRAANARDRIANLQQNQLQWSLAQLEQAILLDLEAGAVAIRQNWLRLDSARRASSLAQQSLDAEQRRYQTGTSSTFVLIRLQTDLVNARIRELLAANEYRKAIVAYDRQTAAIIDGYTLRP